MKGAKVLFSSKSDEYETPDSCFSPLHKKHKFTLDVAATKKNAKCKKFYTKKENGLKQKWKGRVWCNPPYSEISKWVEKAKAESLKKYCEFVIMLLPARTDTKWFHQFVWDQAAARPYRGVSITFIKGRLKFGKETNSAPFPSMLVSWEKPLEPGTVIDQVFNRNQNKGDF